MPPRKPRVVTPTFTTRDQAGLTAAAPPPTADAPPPMGDNNPPPDPPFALDAEEATDGLKARTATCAGLAMEIQLAAAVLPDKMPPDEELDAALDELASFDVTARKAAADIEATRILEKAGYLDGTRLVDEFFKPWSAGIESRRKAAADLKTKIAARVRDLAQTKAKREAEEARLAAAAKRLEAEQLAAEGMQHAADQVNQQARAVEKAADRAERVADGPIRTASGVSVSIGSSWVGTVTDYAALRATLGTLGPHFTDPALDAAVRLAVKAGVRELAGVSIKEFTSSGAR